MSGAGNTLQTTALVNEVYLRMVDVKNVDWQQRAQFFAISAQMMRRILVDAARARGSGKRGGAAVKLNVDEIPVVSPERDSALVALDEVLEVFSKVAPRQAKVVELRYFGGLSEEEIVEVLKISPRTVRRDWEFVKSWLMRELSRSRCRCCGPLPLRTTGSLHELRHDPIGLIRGENSPTVHHPDHSRNTPVTGLTQSARRSPGRKVAMS